MQSWRRLLSRRPGWDTPLRAVVLSMGMLTALNTMAEDSNVSSERVPKTLLVIVDGIPTDVIERVKTPGLDALTAHGKFSHAYVGGGIGEVTESPTISAVGYMSLLTGTWSNKHNVRANYDLTPDYHYWDIFRVAKQQDRFVTTGLFATWTDNRTILLGDGLAQAGGDKFDFVADGFDKDPTFKPDLDELERIQAIDHEVTRRAVETITHEGPDLSWVYLQHTDDVGHLSGDGPEMDRAVRWIDARLAQLWRAVQARQAEHAAEDWLVLVTTDHGRSAEDGKHHGGQSLRERTTWIATNSRSVEFDPTTPPAIVDIFPSVASHMNFKIPTDVRRQLEGRSLIHEEGSLDAK